jgi:hypothetical protein
MATITYSQLFAAVEAPTTEADLFTVPAQPAGNILINGAIKVVNRTGGAIAYSLWETPSGTSADSNNAITDFSVPVNDFVIIPLDQLIAGQVVRHVAGAIGLTVHFNRGYLQAP